MKLNSVLILSVAQPASGLCLAPRSRLLFNERNDRLRFGTSLSAGADADDLQEEARKLREEIEAFERTKTEQEEAEKRAVSEAKREVQKDKDFYSAILPILKPDGSTMEEKVEFTPISKKKDTRIVVLEGSLPLGMILEEGDIVGTTLVDQVAPDSNAALAGVQEGDYLRACTACEMNMEAPT